MKKDRKFFAGLVGVAAVVTYLIWTGLSGTMRFFVTPAELMDRVAAEPTAVQRTWRVGGLLVPGSHHHSLQDQLHTFVIVDPDNPDVRFDVEYRNALPDTFTDDPSMEVELVIEGTFHPGEGAASGRFVATEVLAKCGSRYEAMPTADVALGDVATTGGGLGG